MLRRSKEEGQKMILRASEKKGMDINKKIEDLNLFLQHFGINIDPFNTELKVTKK